MLSTSVQAILSGGTYKKDYLTDYLQEISENIITLISAIKLLLSINKNIIFIIGVDKKAVTLVLENKYNNGEQYNINGLLVRFSSYKIMNNEIRSMIYVSGEAHTDLANWLGAFEENNNMNNNVKKIIVIHIEHISNVFLFNDRKLHFLSLK